jgi:hypothetical protein
MKSDRALAKEIAGPLEIFLRRGAQFRRVDVDRDFRGFAARASWL